MTRNQSDSHGLPCIRCGSLCTLIKYELSVFELKGKCHESRDKMQYSHKLTVESCLFISSVLLALSGDAGAETSSATYTVTTELKEQGPGCTIQIKNVDFGSLYANQVHNEILTINQGLTIECTSSASVSYPVISGINTFENDECKFQMKRAEGVEDGAIGFSVRHFHNSYYRDICNKLVMPDKIRVDATTPHHSELVYVLFRNSSIEPIANQNYIARPTVNIEYQ